MLQCLCDWTKSRNGRVFFARQVFLKLNKHVRYHQTLWRPRRSQLRLATKAFCTFVTNVIPTKFDRLTTQHWPRLFWFYFLFLFLLTVRISFRAFLFHLDWKHQQNKTKPWNTLNGLSLCFTFWSLEHGRTLARSTNHNLPAPTAMADRFVERQVESSHEERTHSKTETFTRYYTLTLLPGSFLHAGRWMQPCNDSLSNETNPPCLGSSFRLVWSNQFFIRNQSKIYQTNKIHQPLEGDDLVKKNTTKKLKRFQNDGITPMSLER